MDTEIKISEKKIQNIFHIKSKMTIPFFENKTEFSPEIDENYIFDEEVTLAVLAGFKYNRRVMLQGLHGTGKSTHIEQVAARLNWPCFRVNLDGYVSRLELVGKDAIILKDGKQITEFQDGIIPFALQRPIALILDEYDAARPDVMFVLQRLLEGEGKFSFIEKNTILNAHKYFRLFATANTLGRGDPTGLYHGTQYINQGQLDRFNIIAKLDYLKADLEEKIIKAKVKEIQNNDQLVKQMVQIANMTRNGFKNGDLSNLISPRTLISWAQDYIIFDDIEKSFRYSFLNKCEDEEKTIIAEYFQRIFGLDIKESVANLI